MRAFAYLLLTVWLICGFVAAFLVADKRPIEPADYLLGPFSVASNW